MLVKGNVRITSDIWPVFPHGIEIEGDLRCSVLHLAGSLKVTGSINAAFLEAGGAISARSIRAASIKSGGDVVAGARIYALAVLAKNITADSIDVTQHLGADNIKAKMVNAGSVRAVGVEAEDVTVEYDLKCCSVKAANLAFGTIAGNGSDAIPELEVGHTTMTGKEGRPWRDSGD